MTDLDEPNPRMIRLILTRREWRDLRIQAAERETSMQSLAAHWISQQLTKARYLDEAKSDEL